MPEDALISFKFTEDHKTDTTLSDTIQREAADRIATYFAMEEMTATKDDPRLSEDTTAKDWDGNVPPDLVDGFDFLL